MKKYALLAASLLMFFSAAPALAGEGPLKVAIAAMLSPKETFVEYRRMVEYIGNKLGRKVELVMRKDYAETDSLLRDSAVDLAFICAGPYVQDRKEFGVELLAAPVVRGKTSYRSFIIVGKGSPYRSLKDLRGKSFAYTDQNSNSGCWAPMYMLAKKGIDPDRFFSKVIYSHGHDSSVEAVANGVVDGAAVDSIIYEYMVAKGSSSARGVKVIEESDDFGIPPVVVPKGLDPRLKAEARKVLLDMHQDPEGRKILGALFIDKFVVPADKSYDSVRDINEYVKKLNKTRAKGK